MILKTKWALPWLQLQREKMRLAVAILGVAFAVILMFVQRGFEVGLLENAVLFHEALNCDAVLISPKSSCLVNSRGFPRSRIYQALSCPGVQAALPIYIAMGIWKNPVLPITRPIFVIGIDPENKVLQVKGINELRENLKLPDVILFDQNARPEYGPIKDMYLRNKGLSIEIENRKMKIAGLFTLGPAFSFDGSVITSDLNFTRIFPERSLGVVDIGVITFDPSYDSLTIVKNLKQYMPGDVQVLTKSEFISLEQQFWQHDTAIGFIFGLGMVLGFLVGCAIVYLILYMDVTDHLAEYATLKALGYSDSYFLLVILMESLILAVLGFIPGYLGACWIYQVASEATGMQVSMDLERIILVFSLTIVMCMISGALTLHKLRDADPADVFS